MSRKAPVTAWFCWFVLALAAACSTDDGTSPSPAGVTTPGRSGVAGEAGAPGEKGDKGEPGDPGILGAVEVFGNRPGPLPLSERFTTSGGKLLITVSGSGYRALEAGGGPLGIDVLIDGVKVASINGFTNEPESHKTLPSRTLYLQQGAAVGMHTLTISAHVDTTTDANDFFNATIIELR